MVSEARHRQVLSVSYCSPDERFVEERIETWMTGDAFWLKVW